MPMRSFVHVVADAVIDADDPAPAISDQPRTRLFGGLEYRFSGLRQYQLVDVGVHGASGILQEAPSCVLPRPQLAEIGIPVIPAIGALRTVFERPLHHDRASDAPDRPERRAQRGAVIGAGAVVIDENGIGAMNVPVESYPIKDPFDRIVLRHREDDAAIPEYLRLVRRNREREAPQFAQCLDRAGMLGNVEPQLCVAVEAPRPRL